MTIICNLERLINRRQQLLSEVRHQVNQSSQIVLNLCWWQAPHQIKSAVKLISHEEERTEDRRTEKVEVVWFLVPTATRLVLPCVAARWTHGCANLSRYGATAKLNLVNLKSHQFRVSTHASCVRRHTQHTPRPARQELC